MDRDRSHALYERALSALPGGVNSPVRAVRPYPFFIDQGEGAHVVDVDGNRYLDYVLGYGPLLLGHTLPEPVTTAIHKQVVDGPMYGAPTEIEIELAEFIKAHVESVEMLRFTNTGTEATTTAIRLARGVTDRDRILVVDGGYHGALDETLVGESDGEGSSPGSDGVPRSTTENTISVPFNDVNAARHAFERHGGEIAAVLVEPLLGNSGCVYPIDGYLETLRELTSEHGALLIFDEVMTGFRIGGLECAQGAFGIQPDLTTFAKVIGGGFPVGAVGGATTIMEHLEPVGDVFHASTYAGHPVGIAAGLETLRYAKANDVFDRLEGLGDQLRRGLSEILAEQSPRYTVVGRGSMFKVVFTRGDASEPADVCATGCRQNPDCGRYGDCPTTASDVGDADGERWERLFWHDMLEQDIFLTANQDESQFLSAAHTEEDIEATLEAYKEAL